MKETQMFNIDAYEGVIRTGQMKTVCKILGLCMQAYPWQEILLDIFCS